MQTTTRTAEPLFSNADAVLSRASLEIVREVLRDVDGVAEVRVLPPRLRPASRRAKVFVVLASHDVRRDSRIVERLCQIPDIDFDLVPAAARGMIPDESDCLRLD